MKIREKERPSVTWRGMKLVAETCGACEGEGCELCKEIGFVTTRGSLLKVRDFLSGDLAVGDRSRDEAYRLIQRHDEFTDEERRAIWFHIHPEDKHKKPKTIDALVQKQRDAMEEAVKEIEMDREGIVKALEAVDEELARVTKVRRIAKERERAQKPPPQEVKATPAKRSTCILCERDAVAWDQSGNAWCKRHAYAEGVLWNEPDIMEGE